MVDSPWVEVVVSLAVSQLLWFAGTVKLAKSIIRLRLPLSRVISLRERHQPKQPSASLFTTPPFVMPYGQRNFFTVMVHHPVLENSLGTCVWKDQLVVRARVLQCHK